MTSSPSRDEVRRQLRDRFIGFAFAGGDLLLETDLVGKIGYVAGAAQTITGHNDQDLLGRNLSDLVLSSLTEEVRQFLSDLGQGERFAPCRIGFEGVGGHWIMLSGYRSDLHADVLLLSLRFDMSDFTDQRPLLKADIFKDQVLDRLQKPDCNATLTMLDLSGLDAWAVEAATACRREIGASLGHFSDDDSTAGWLSDDVLGIVQDEELDLDALEEAIRTHSKVADPNGVGLTPKSTALSMNTKGLKSGDAAQAMLYAINRFAEGKEEGFSINSLRESFDIMVKETIERVVEVRDTVSKDDVELNFQSIVDLRTKTVHHYEVLSRLKDGQSPFELVSFAEQVGLIADFDLMVCRRVIAMLKQQKKREQILAVNLSARSMGSEAFGRALLTLLARHPEVRTQLMFELTESATITDPEPVANLIAALRRTSIRVCLDDFGSGAAAFHYLRAFPFDYIKIDGVYIQSTHKRDHAILKGMASLCRELGVKSVAEMVETKIQAERLSRLGIDFGQGYLFGRPKPYPGTEPRSGSEPGSGNNKRSQRSDAS
ncbi:MAG: sensor domain-containing phosphodiesterase [Geminicoccaceae bacterium]